MKVSALLKNILTILIISLIVISVQSCKKTENPIKYIKGTFPDSAINLNDINTIYDDYNSSLTELYGYTSLVFSSNRRTHGGTFDFVQGFLYFTFDRTSGLFEIESDTLKDNFITSLLIKANTAGNDLGPIRAFSLTDGYEYFIYSSQTINEGLDFFYTKNLPTSGYNFPEIYGPYPISLLNTSADDAYLCFNPRQDSVYFSSNRDGLFDIYFETKPGMATFSSWFDQGFSASEMVDSVNSEFNDKCPFVQKNLMIFTSDREGGMGGYDLYYSILKNGKWSSPVNMGPDVNTQYNEYRPIIGYHADFTNLFMIFSSDRPGGKGGYDLYFKGLNIP
jgi:hypothetical protein